MAWEKAAFNRLVHIIKRGDRSRAEGPVLWVGAGLSVGAGYPTWTGLAEALRGRSCVPLAEELSGTELIDAFVATNGEGDLADAMAALFPPRKHLPQHENLVALPWESIVTTNYDELLEDGCRARGIDYLTITLEQNLDVLSNKLRVNKVHGGLSDYRSIILDSRSYLRFAEKYPRAMGDLGFRLRKHSLVFFGCSMTDPRLTHWLQKLGSEGRAGLKSSVAVLTEHDWRKLSGEDQKLLQEAHIEGLLVQHYEDIPKLIEDLCGALGIETVDRPVGGGGGTGLIGFLAKLCDRKPQVSHVLGALPLLRQEVRSPQVFLMYGHERQSPDSLVERLSRVDIRRRAESFWGISYFPPAVEVRWPAEMDITRAMPVLLKNLFDALGVSGWDHQIHPAAGFLCEAYEGRPRAVRCCHHTIEAGRWYRATAALVSGYLQFWEEVYQLQPQTSFIIFLKLVYGGWGRLVPFARRRRELRRLCERSPVFRGTLPKLSSVGREDVRSWFREQRLTAARPVGELVKEWYGRRPMGLPIETVENRLTEAFASRREAR